MFAQLAVDDDRRRGLESGAQHGIGATASLFVHPAHRKARVFDDPQHLLERQRHATLTDRFRGTLDVGKLVLPRLLPYPHQQAGELASTSAGLRQQLRQCELQ